MYNNGTYKDFLEKFEATATAAESGVEPKIVSGGIEGISADFEARHPEVARTARLTSEVMGDASTVGFADKTGQSANRTYLSEDARAVVQVGPGVDGAPGKMGVRVMEYDSLDDARMAFGDKLEATTINIAGKPSGHPDLFQNGAAGLESGLKGIKAGLDAAMDSNFVSKGGDFLASTGRFMLKGLPVVGAGVVANEMVGLGLKAADYEKYGLMSGEATMAYGGIAAAYVGASAVDPTVVGADAAFELAMEGWKTQFGISDAVFNDLSPETLIDTMGKLRDGLMSAGADVRDTVRDWGETVAESGAGLLEDVRIAGDLADGLHGLTRNLPDVLPQLDGMLPDPPHMDQNGIFGGWKPSLPQLDLPKFGVPSLGDGILPSPGAGLFQRISHDPTEKGLADWEEVATHLSTHLSEVVETLESGHASGDLPGAQVALDYIEGGGLSHDLSYLYASGTPGLPITIDRTDPVTRSLEMMGATESAARALEADRAFDAQAEIQAEPDAGYEI